MSPPGVRWHVIERPHDQVTATDLRHVREQYDVTRVRSRSAQMIQPDVERVVECPNWLTGCAWSLVKMRKDERLHLSKRWMIKKSATRLRVAIAPKPGDFFSTNTPGLAECSNRVRIDAR